MLAELLDKQIASILADEVHKDVSTVNTAVLPTEEFNVDCDNLAIWIDPIGLCLYESKIFHTVKSNCRWH